MKIECNHDDELEQLRETNRRLHRRVQAIEGEKRYQNAWSDGYRAGSSSAYDRAKKDFDKRMADYKHATRTEMAKLRDQSNQEITSGTSGVSGCSERKEQINETR
jgi:flagellar biosynthesis/type III secretory pathway protein FliH